MKFAGFTDEAATSLEGQIQVTRTLGWDALELRAIDGKNVENLTRKEIEETRNILDRYEISVCALGSTIANWGESVDAPFAETLEKVKKDIDWMKILGTDKVRIMSYALLMDENGRILPDQKAGERFARLREICSRFLDAGFTPIHENCHTYGGMSWEHTMQLTEEVPGLKLVFDTGNPPLTPDFREDYPYPMQNSWDFYTHVRKYIAHVHIKDAKYGEFGVEETYTYPGEGDGCLAEVVTDLLRTGYDGYFSIEPHMAVVFHDSSVKSSDEVKFNTYVTYGKKFVELYNRSAAEASRDIGV